MVRPNKILEDHALDTLFRQARTFKKWRAEPVSDVMLKALYDLLKWGPTSTNCCPMRIVFVKSPEAKEKLKPFLDKGNVDPVMTAPVTAIIGYDKKFYDQLPKLSPHNNARSWFVDNEALANETAIRNGTLQGGYLILAARALGLDCGPMSGFNKDAVRKAFFADAGQPDVVVNFICNLGFGDPDGLYPRGQRLDFEESCKII